VVKVKSMASREIGLNEALEAAGIAAGETDLAELIVQLGHDRPSHILVPAIHHNRAEIRDIFLRHMPGVDPAPSRTTPTGGWNVELSSGRSRTISVEPGSKKWSRCGSPQRQRALELRGERSRPASVRR
jgi:hypothetical protein